MVAGIQPLLLEAVLIGLGIGRQRQEAHHQALFPGPDTFADQTLGMLFILDVLVARIAALMAGDEFGVEIDAETVGIGFEGQAPVGVVRRARNTDWCRA